MTVPPNQDPVVRQRTLVYALYGIVCVAGILLVIAFRGIPSWKPFVAMGISWVSMMLCYELRWYLRVGAVGTIGLALLVAAGGMVYLGLPKVLAVVHGLLGIALMASSYGIYREHRGPWSFAVTCFGTLAMVFFFGASRVRSAMDVNLAWAVLPSMALFLPACVMLGTSSPGSPRYEPWASSPRARR